MPAHRNGPVSSNVRHHMNSATFAGLSVEALLSDLDLKIAVDLFEALQREVKGATERHINELDEAHAWALLQSMYLRSSAHTEACLALLSNEHFASAEALCRTVIESAVNLYYSSRGDSASNVLIYFKNYISTERGQNRNWRNSVANSKHPKSSKDTHFERIANKDLALNRYEYILTEAFGQIGIDYSKTSESWPSIFDRFREIDKELEYRTVYAALCSQAHNDPEDLLNEFVHGVLQTPGMKEAQDFENKNFARYMVLVALAFHIESTGIYLAKFFPETNNRVLPLLKSAWDAIAEITSRVPS